MGVHILLEELRESVSVPETVPRVIYEPSEVLSGLSLIYLVDYTIQAFKPQLGACDRTPDLRRCLR